MKKSFTGKVTIKKKIKHKAANNLSAAIIVCDFSR